MKYKIETKAHIIDRTHVPRFCVIAFWCLLKQYCFLFSPSLVRRASVLSASKRCESIANSHTTHKPLVFSRVIDVCFFLCTAFDIAVGGDGDDRDRPNMNRPDWQPPYYGNFTNCYCIRSEIDSLLHDNANKSTKQTLIVITMHLNSRAIP